MSTPSQELQEGARILRDVLASYGFSYVATEAGRGSGGQFATGEFIRGDYILSFSVRHGLGIVEYSVGGRSISHEDYLRYSGVWEVRSYPGYGGSIRDDFEGLAKDLASHLASFVRGERDTFLSVVALREANPIRFKGFSVLGRNSAA